VRPVSTVRLTTLVCIAVLFVTSAAGERAGHVPQSIGVIVRLNTKPIRPVQKARVFILGAAGHDLATGVTDETGTVYLRYTPGPEAPLYVFVEAPACYISGLRWEPEAQEYYILVTGRAVM
jgi:hypothetical protein